MNKTCKFCGKEFTVKHGRQIFCSVSCRKNEKSKNNLILYHQNKILKGQIKLICEVCQKQFTKEWQKQKYCSRECAKVRNRSKSKEYQYNFKKKYGLFKKEKPTVKEIQKYNNDKIPIVATHTNYKYRLFEKTYSNELLVYKMTQEQFDKLYRKSV